MMKTIDQMFVNNKVENITIYRPTSELHFRNMKSWMNHNTIEDFYADDDLMFIYTKDKNASNIENFDFSPKIFDLDMVLNNFKEKITLEQKFFINNTISKEIQYYIDNNDVNDKHADFFDWVLFGDIKPIYYNNNQLYFSSMEDGITFKLKFDQYIVQTKPKPKEKNDDAHEYLKQLLQNKINNAYYPVRGTDGTEW